MFAFFQKDLKYGNFLHLFGDILKTIPAIFCEMLALRCCVRIGNRKLPFINFGCELFMLSENGQGVDGDNVIFYCFLKFIANTKS